MCEKCQLLLTEIESYKKPKGVDWVLHSGDIVIDHSVWRRIKKRYENVGLCTQP